MKFTTLLTCLTLSLLHLACGGRFQGASGLENNKASSSAPVLFESQLHSISGTPGKYLVQASDRQIPFELDESGTVLLQGDMVLGSIDELKEALLNAESVKGSSQRVGAQGYGKRSSSECSSYFLWWCIRRSNLDMRWPSGQIKYSIDSNASDDLHQAVYTATSYWNQNVVFVKWVYDPTFANRIVFREVHSLNGGAAGTSPVGYTGKLNYITIRAGFDVADYKGVFLHAIGHSAGLEHEHTRPDRDQYISVDVSQVKEDMKMWYNQIVPSTGRIYLSEYDHRSVMHYQPYCHSLNCEAGATGAIYSSKDPNVPTSEIGIASAMGFLTRTDIVSLNKLYSDM